MIFLYRKNGGEVLGVTSDPSSYAGVDATYFGTVTDPSTPDGSSLATPKMFVSPSTVRNATAPEISNFAVASATDDNLQQRTSALALATTDPTQRKILIGIVSVLIDELNALRQWNESLRAASTASSNFATLKSGLSALAATPDRTLAQAKTAITNKVNGGTVD